MIKVLLVDDEQFIRQGLRKLIDWNAYGFEVAAEAENGLQAIEILEKTDIELVFVDIRMPGMTGIELIEYLQKKTFRTIHFVILTGYADFEYVRKALRLHVVDYMLKPVQEEELIKILIKANREYTKELYEEKEKYEFSISKVLTGKFSKEDIEIIKEKLQAGNTWKYVSFEFDRHQKGFIQLERQERLEQQKILMQYLQDLLGEYAYHVVPMIIADEEIFGAGILLTECICEKQNMQKEDYLDYLQKRVTQHFSYRIQAYMGETCTSLEEISKSFYSLRVARCLHGLAGEEGSIVHEKAAGQKKIGLAIEEADVDMLLNAVKNNQIGEIESCSEKIFKQIRNSDMHMEMVNASIYHILFRLMEMVKEFDDETNQQEILEYIGKESFNKLVLSGDTKEITGFFSDYAGYLSQVRNQESKNILDKVDEYVQEHYMEKLSLKSLGEMFYINNVYLGQIYKKKYGIVFRDYLNMLRMKKAEELLVNTDMRIYTIAESVGFGKVEYFINKFVQINQMTPNQYRIHHKKK
ncbi:MAG: response regulator [Lachnospiraceae bacterium]|nr:response regulator [Lachnospiraceae bacterium]